MFKKLMVRAGIATTILAASVTAHAALPAAVETAFDSFQSDANDMLAKGWPLLLLIFGSMVAMKLFKKIANKAT